MKKRLLVPILIAILLLTALLALTACSWMDGIIDNVGKGDKTDSVTPGSEVQDPNDNNGGSEVTNPDDNNGGNTGNQGGNNNSNDNNGGNTDNQGENNNPNDNNGNSNQEGDNNDPNAGIKPDDGNVDNIIEQFVFDLNEDKKSYYVKSYVGNATVVEVPAAYKDLPVTVIGERAFCDNKKIKKVVLPDSIVEISDLAFSNCMSLADINMPDDLTIIGESAFEFCFGINNILLPSDLTTIKQEAFAYCIGLVSINLPEKLETIEDDAFTICMKLIEVYNESKFELEPESEGYGGVAAYARNIYTPDEGKSKLITDDDGYVMYVDESDVLLVAYIGHETDLIFPAEVTEVYNYAFIYSDITRFIGYNIKSIGANAFVGSECLQVIELPESVITIGDNAFGDCSSLVEVVITDNVTTIGECAFLGCDMLSCVTIGKSVQEIGEGAFGENNRLVEIYNKSKLNIEAGSDENGSIGYYALNIYTPDSGESKLYGENGYILYYDDDDVILVNYTGSETDLVVPSNVTKIREYAFMGYSEDSNPDLMQPGKITSIVIPDSVTSIGWAAFSDCHKLTKVVMGDNVVELGGMAFRDCDKLTDINLSARLERIEMYTFEGCDSLFSIVIPDRVVSIGECAFSGCDNLITVTLGTNLIDIDRGAFNCLKLVEIYNKSSLNIVKGSKEHGNVGYRALNIYTPEEGESKLTIDSNGFVIFGGGTNAPQVSNRDYDYEIVDLDIVFNHQKYKYTGENIIPEIKLADGEELPEDIMCNLFFESDGSPVISLREEGVYYIRAEFTNTGDRYNTPEPIVAIIIIEDARFDVSCDIIENGMFYDESFNVKRPYNAYWSIPTLNYFTTTVTDENGEQWELLGVNYTINGETPSRDTILNVGTYLVTCTIQIGANYDDELATIYYHYILTVVQAENEIVAIYMPDWTYGEVAPSPTASAKFNESAAQFTYSVSGEEWTDIMPTEVGEYYIRAAILADPDGNYTDCCAQKRFSIKSPNGEDNDNGENNNNDGSIISITVSGADGYIPSDAVVVIIESPYEIPIHSQECLFGYMIGVTNNAGGSIYLDCEVTIKLLIKEEFLEYENLNAYFVDENYLNAYSYENLSARRSDENYLTFNIDGRMINYGYFVVTKDSDNYYNDNSRILVAYLGDATEVILPEDITGINQYAFYGCEQITSITIGSNVTYIGNYLFRLAYMIRDNLKTVNYLGTVEQWEAIYKEYFWDGDTDSYVIHCSDGDIVKN